MSTLWPQVKSLLARVRKPARSIGREDGTIAPRPTESAATPRFPSIAGADLRASNDRDVRNLHDRHGSVDTVANLTPATVGPRRDHHGDRSIADLAIVGAAQQPVELADVARPDLDPVDVRVPRTHLSIDHDGERRDVLLPADVHARPDPGARTTRTHHGRHHPARRRDRRGTSPRPHRTDPARVDATGRAPLHRDD